MNKHQRRRRNGQFDFSAKPAVSAQPDAAASRAALDDAVSTFQDALSTVESPKGPSSVGYEALNDAYTRLKWVAADHDSTTGGVGNAGASEAAAAKHAASEAILRKVTANYGGEVREVTHYHDHPDYDPPWGGHRLSDLTISVSTVEGHDCELAIRLNGDSQFAGDLPFVDHKARSDGKPCFVVPTNPAIQPDSLLHPKGCLSVGSWINAECEKMDLDRRSERPYVYGTESYLVRPQP